VNVLGEGLADPLYEHPFAFFVALFSALCIGLLAACSGPERDAAIKAQCVLDCFENVAPGASSAAMLNAYGNACQNLCAPPKPPEASELERLKAQNAELAKKLEALAPKPSEASPEAAKP